MLAFGKPHGLGEAPFLGEPQSRGEPGCDCKPDGCGKVRLLGEPQLRGEPGGECELEGKGEVSLRGEPREARARRDLCR